MAETYGCSLGTIRYRAVREGWRRCDVAGFEPASPPPSPSALAGPAAALEVEAGAVEPQDIGPVALAAAMRAVRAGKPSEAAAWLRVVSLSRAVTPREAVWDDPDDGRFDSGDDVEPADIKQVYGDLEVRLERLTAVMEAKRAAELAEGGGPLPPTSPRTASGRGGSPRRCRPSR
ncbi:MAG TPA: hypothetical protein VF138_11995 [Caulobacteraceae bacterium]